VRRHDPPDRAIGTLDLLLRRLPAMILPDFQPRSVDFKPIIPL